MLHNVTLHLNLNAPVDLQIMAMALYPSYFRQFFCPKFLPIVLTFHDSMIPNIRDNIVEKLNLFQSNFQYLPHLYSLVLPYNCTFLFFLLVFSLSLQMIHGYIVTTLSSEPLANAKLNF